MNDNVRPGWQPTVIVICHACGKPNDTPNTGAQKTMTKMKPLIVPTINRNGNTASSLVDQLSVLLGNITNLKRVMRDCSDVTHGRNFQTLADADQQRNMAVDAWTEWQLKLIELHNEVMRLAIAIQEQERPKPIDIASSVPKGWDSVEGGPTNGQ